MRIYVAKHTPYRLLIFGALLVKVFGADVLKTAGFTTCLANPDIEITGLDVQYDRSASTVSFNVAGTSPKEQKVSAKLIVSAYGKQVYQKEFNPCDNDTKVTQLCPVPSGSFTAKGTQTVPSQLSDQIPPISFRLPDIEGEAKMNLKSLDSGQDLACIKSYVNNGKTVDIPALSYATVGIAGAAFVLTSLASLGNAGNFGGHAVYPNFGDVLGWFQSMAMNGMLSVNYPHIYRSFTKSFAFSGGLVSWDSMQIAIDNFRRATGGNLTEDNVHYLRNATLVFSDGGKSLAKRSLVVLEPLVLKLRDLSMSINGSHFGDGAENSPSNSSDNEITHAVHGIQGYVEQLTIPQANTFMAVLLIFTIVVAVITVGILLLKVILETWALFGSFPKKLAGFRKRYWGLLGRTITNLILLLYGLWTLYCIYQFKNGDSWAAKILAGTTLAVFTAILGFFTLRIRQLAEKFRNAEGNTSALFEDKETWRKYSLFYDNYKRGCWWLFMPVILYMFAKGCVIAAGSGHGLVQTSGQLIIESLMLILVLWNRPYATTAGNWINSIIQIVRLLSVVCILVFVEELGISQSTKTFTGIALVVMQSLLTAALALLITMNSIIICCKQNPHRRRRKEAEKFAEDFNNLTPLDARNSLLLDPADYRDFKGPRTTAYPLMTYNEQMSSSTHQIPLSHRWHEHESSENLLSSAASIGYENQHNVGENQGRSR